MGACATKSGDLKIKGEPPLVVDDAVVAPPVAEGEKMKADGVSAAAAAEADPADVSRRRSLSDLLKEDAATTDGDEAGQEAVKVVTHEDSAVATDDEAVGAPASHSKEAEVQATEAAPQVAVEPCAAVVEQGTAEQLADDTEACQEPGGGEAQAAEEEKRVDPDPVQGAVAVAAAAPSAGKSEVADGTSA